MKHAGKYKPKLKRLIKKGLAKRPKDPEVPPGDPIGALVLGIIEADTTPKQAEKAFKALEREYVDFNELRASPVRDIIECIGEDYPDVFERATMIRTVLGGIFAQCSSVSLDYLAKLPKRDLRQRLAELGLNEYASGMAMLMGLGIHAIPLDRDLADCMEMAGCVYPDSEMADIQGFIERAVPKQSARAGHEFFREYVQTKAKPLAKRHKAEAERRAAEAEVKAAAEAEAKAAAEAEAKAAAKAEKARKQAEKKKAAKKKTAKKKTARKAARTTPRARKKAAARKTVKKAARKTAKKATRKAAKKTTRKAAKKTAAGKTSARSVRQKK